MATAMIMVMVMAHQKKAETAISGSVATVSWPFRLLIVVVASALAWLTAVNGVAGIAASSNPMLAQKIAPFDSRANAAVADFQLQSSAEGNPPSSTGDYARRAIARDPLSVSSYRVLGMLADIDRNPSKAVSLVRYAGVLSRRDFGTQLWLIQNAVDRKNVPEALAQFDVTLRAIPQSHAFLFPILARALEDKEYIEPIANVLKTSPSWMEPFGAYAINNGVATGNLAQVFTKLRSSTVLKKSSLPQMLVNELIARDNAMVAYRYAAAVSGNNVAMSGVSDPNFMLRGGLSPFAWLLRQDGDIFVAANDPGIRVSAQNGRAGVGASQILALSSARYRLATTGHYARTAPDQLIWKLSCVGASGPLIGQVAVVSSSADRLSESDVIVPEGCPMQWLKLEVAPDDEPGAFEGQVTSVNLLRIPSDTQVNE